jgi:hypothetical protein
MYTTQHYGLALVHMKHEYLHQEAARARRVRQAIRPASTVSSVRMALSLVQSWRSPMRWAWGG